MKKQQLCSLYYFLSILIFIFVLLSPDLLCAANAGVLPYTIKNKKIYILLGNDSHRTPFGWSDFGGGAKDLKDLKKSAAIEGHEETMGRFYRNLEDPGPERYALAGIQYFIDRCLDDNKVESTSGYLFYFVQVPYISSADLMKTRATLMTRRATTGKPSHDYLEKDDFAWIEGQYFLDEILKKKLVSFDPKAKPAMIEISLKSCELEPVRDVKFLNRYFIHSMIQTKSKEILQRLIKEAQQEKPIEKVMSSLINLKKKLTDLKSAL